jgi:predicted amidohydrolase
MVHVAQAEKFYELDYYEPSDTGFLVFDTELGKIGTELCLKEDLYRQNRG